MNLTSQQKLQILRDLDNSSSLGFSRALTMFDEYINKLTTDREKEFKKVIDEMKAEIKSLQLKDGYTPRKFIDYFTPTELDQIIKASTPQKGIDYMLPSDMESVHKDIANKLMSMITVKDGVTPKAGIDYPTLEQVKQLIDDEFVKLESAEDVQESGDNVIGGIKEKFSAVELTGEDIIKKINSLPLEAKFQIPASRIIGLPKLKKEDKKYLHGGSHGGGVIVKVFDISASLNGIIKTFTIPTNSLVIAVHASSSPFSAFRPTIDFTYTSNSITFTSQIDAATILSNGQSLLIEYAEA